LNLSVNLEKSKIVIFRNGGYIAKREKWFYKGNELKVVNSYKYLGVWMSTRLSFSHAIEYQTRKAIAGSMVIMKTLWQLGDLNPEIFFKMFDSQINPIILYGAEIWGLQKHNNLEKAQLSAVKKLLNVSSKTPNDLVYGETGRRPMFIEACVATLRYWLRLTRMENDRLPKKAYNMLMSMHGNNKKCWITDVHDVLMMYGFGYVWLNHGVQHVKWFLKVFNQRLSDCWIQGWHSRLQDSERYFYYRMFKTSFGTECYFDTISNLKLRNCLIRFRLGISDILCHKNRFKCNVTNTCPVCNNDEENDFHFLFHCPAYKQMRNTLFALVNYSYNTVDVYSKIMCDRCNAQVISKFVYFALKQRSMLLELKDES
jgi:hypothetical protein